MADINGRLIDFYDEWTGAAKFPVPGRCVVCGEPISTGRYCPKCQCDQCHDVRLDGPMRISCDKCHDKGTSHSGMYGTIPNDWPGMVAVCACGWRSGRYRTRYDALREWANEHSGAMTEWSQALSRYNPAKCHGVVEAVFEQTAQGVPGGGDPILPPPKAEQQPPVKFPEIRKLTRQGEGWVASGKSDHPNVSIHRQCIRRYPTPIYRPWQVTSEEHGGVLFEQHILSPELRAWMRTATRTDRTGDARRECCHGGSLKAEPSFKRKVPAEEQDRRVHPSLWRFIQPEHRVEGRYVRVRFTCKTCGATWVETWEGASSKAQVA